MLMYLSLRNLTLRTSRQYWCNNFHQYLRTVSKKNKLWNFPSSWLGGSSITRFSIKKKNNMVLKHFILPVEHFKANLFFSIMTPLTHPITHPRDCLDGYTKRGDVGLIKVKKKLTLKFILGDLKHF